MSMRWERFAGDTSLFAARLAFHRDPDDGEAATPDLAESWGAFQLWVRGRNLCAHIDQGEELRSCHWYLLPLLEWLSENWDPLFHEERPPAGRCGIRTASDVSGIASASANATEADDNQLDEFEQQFDWRERHTLRAARQGGIFPDVRFRRYRDQVEVSWTANPLPGAEDVHFMSPEGTDCLSPSAVAHPLHEVLTSAAEWLHAQIPHSERCWALVESVRALRSQQRAPERIAWLAKLGDSKDQMVQRWRRVEEFAHSMASSSAKKAFDAAFGVHGSSEVVVEGSCTAALLFGSTSPTIDDTDAKSLAGLLLAAYEAEPVDGLAEFVYPEPLDSTQPPWQHGYDLAEELLDALDRSDVAVSDSTLEAWLADWRVRVEEIALNDTEVRAVSFVSDKHTPTIVLNRSHWSAADPRARRFTLAHELCHLLHDRSYGARLAIASGPWAPIQIERRANAFAAWLLMPPGRLKPAIAWAHGAINTHEGISAVADDLDVSRSALVRHLFNLGEINEEDQDALLAGAAVPRRR
ncbi:ImmA/IrrE family metallo-endopeptidase [Candidatus Poriferisodalis sp.]|uniref:ImmA/IrrE family metallo-endopeptidase n=1 Tax=Candidatus Poriferisodalis sp. TaxID=3101277 RepID=UPI003B5AB431